MKFSVRLSNAGMVSIIGLIVAILLLADINTHRNSGLTATTTGSGVLDKVVTKEFVMVDDNGNVRARIGMNDVDAPSMQLFDRHGQQRAMLRLNKDDVPSLRLYDDAGKVRSVTGFNLNTMAPQFILFDDNGNGRPVNNATDNVINLQTDSGMSFLTPGFYHDEDVVRGHSIFEPQTTPYINVDMDSSGFRLMSR